MNVDDLEKAIALKRKIEVCSNISKVSGISATVKGNKEYSMLIEMPEDVCDSIRKVVQKYRRKYMKELDEL